MTVKHKISYDEQNKVVLLEVSGEYTFEDARQTVQLMRDSFSDKAPYPFLLDLEKLSSDLDKDTRRFLQKEASDLGILRMAMVVTNPMIRMTAKIVASTISKKGETGFFKTRGEAFIWLKGEK